MKMSRKETDLEWVESFAQDMYDPTSFKQAFLKVMKPVGTGLLEPISFIPYKYQTAWTEDDSDKKVIIKPRQIGFSVNESLDTLHASLINNNYKKLFTSLKQEQATKNLTVIREAIELMEENYKIKLKRKSDKMIEFPNGSKIYALPSSDDGARGFSGDIFLDEFAFVPNDKELMRGIQSVAVREGYKITMGSTPYGQRGEFHRIVKEAGWNTQSTWLDQATSTKQEFYDEYKRVLNENETDWSFHVVAWWMCPDLTWDNILKATETEADREQEFGLGFLDDTTSMFSYDILLSRANSKKAIFNPDGRYIKTESVRRIAGLDPAEKNNKTAYVVWDFYPKTRKWYKRFQQTWHNVSLSQYVDEITTYHKLWSIDHMYMDMTGMGIGVYSMFKDRGFTESQITGVKFTNPLKYDLVHNALSLYESEPQAIFTDMNEEYNKQFHQVRKEINRYGKATFTGKIEGKDDDIFWGSVLGLIENIEYDDGEVWFEVMDMGNTYRSNKYV